MAFQKEMTLLNVSLFADAWNNENANVLLEQEICSLFRHARVSTS